MSPLPPVISPRNFSLDLLMGLTASGVHQLISLSMAHRIESIYRNVYSRIVKLKLRKSEWPSGLRRQTQVWILAALSGVKISGLR